MKNPFRVRMGVVAASVTLAVGLLWNTAGAAGSAPTAPASVNSAGPSQIEVVALAQLLETAHPLRDKGKTERFRAIVPDLMRTLDPDHAIFLGDDERDLLKATGEVYYVLRYTGGIPAAGIVFDRFKQRWRERESRIAHALERELPSADAYTVDAKREAWPRSIEEADGYWLARLAAERNAEQSAGAKPEAIVATLRARYRAILANVLATDVAEQAEAFLTAFTMIYDPHSVYFGPGTFSAFRDQMEQRPIAGVGLAFQAEGLNCTITEVTRDGPAAQAGTIHVGDRIVAIAEDGADPVEIGGMSTHRVTHLTRGPVGSTVHLTFVSSSGTAPFVRRTVKLTRGSPPNGVVRAHAAIYDLSAEKQRRIGVIAVPALYGAIKLERDSETSVSKDIEQILGQLKGKVDGVVLDLRHNGGGYLTEAIAVTQLFVPRGPILQVRNYNGEIQIDEGERESAAYTGPLVVLIDSRTASGAEIIAGALQQYGRALIVGAPTTHGSGTIQQVIEMKQWNPVLAEKGKPSGAVKFTIQQFYLPDGSSTQAKGVASDLVLPGLRLKSDRLEADLPHAMLWDKIPTTVFEGHPYPESELARLKKASADRQQKLPEFDWLRRRNAWLEGPDKWPLAIEDWRKAQAQQEAEAAALVRQQHELSKTAYAHEELHYESTEGVSAKSNPTMLDNIYPDEFVSFDRFDVNLFEAMRIAIDLSARK